MPRIMNEKINNGLSFNHQTIPIPWEIVNSKSFKLPTLLGVFSDPNPCQSPINPYLGPEWGDLGFTLTHA